MPGEAPSLLRGFMKPVAAQISEERWKGVGPGWVCIAFERLGRSKLPCSIRFAMSAPSVPVSEPGYKLARAVLLPWLKGAFKSHIEGSHHLPAEGPAIVAVNHVSLFDPLIVAYAVDQVGRRPRFFAKASLFKLPFVGWILRSAGQIPVHRGTRQAVASLEEAIAAIEAGQLVVIFPEGTVPLDENITPLEPKTGMARLALATGAPVIPCATWGGQWIWGYHVGFRPGFGKDVWVRFGTPMSFSELSGRRDDPEAWDRVGRSVMDELSAMLAAMKAAKPWKPQPLARAGRRKLASKGASHGR